MQNEKEFSPQESLLLIQSMIDKTKMSVAGNTTHFLIWGWLAFIICIAQYILLAVLQNEHHYYVWFFIWIGIFFEIRNSIQNKNKEKVHTYLGDSMKSLWRGLGVTFFVTAMVCALSHWINCLPLFIILYAVGTFVSGCFLRFKPLIIGGILCWIIALIAANFSYDLQILFTALALLVSYIIPGHLLRKQYQQH